MIDAAALLSMEAFCGPSSANSAAVECGPLASLSGPGSCGVPDVLQIFAGAGNGWDGNGGGRCHVWAANLFLTLGVLSVVLVRIWCTCGDLPPSDAAYEPAAGKVIHREPPNANARDENGNAEDDVDIQMLVADVLCSSRVSKASAAPRRGNAASPTSSFACTSTSPNCRLCGARLPPGAREEQVCTSRAYEQTNAADSSDRADPPSSPPAVIAAAPAAAAPHDAKSAASTGATALGGGARDGVACHSRLRCRLTRVWRVVYERCRAFVDACATVYAMWRMPFSALERYSSTAYHADLRRLRRRVGRRLRATPSPQETGRGSSSDSDGERDEDDAFAAEQEELWGILLAIEHRRRALTGRNLYREQLPARPRHGRRHRDTRDDVRWATRQLRTASLPPIVAAGVPLRFSTNRQERPLLEDRRGRWIPVAVTDDEGQRYDFRVDQVLPDLSPGG